MSQTSRVAVVQAPPPTRPTLPPRSAPPPTSAPPTSQPVPTPPPPTTTLPTPPPTTAPVTTAPATTAITPAAASGSGSDSGSTLPIVIGLLVVLAVVAAVALLLRRRRHRAPAPLRRAESMDALLDVSRRLTSAATSGDIDGAIVRDALGLVHATGAALVHQDGDDLRIGHESHEDLLVPERLGDGVVRRVAETGQPLVQVSASETAIRNLPAALLAVPLVGGGRVAAILVVVRPASEPFQPEERDLLSALAPVAAAALQTARSARASLEETMIDPLTGIGNRRRLDAELPAALADGSRVAVVMVDLDHFKAVNDTHGHPAGDKLLQQVAAVIRDTIRPSDSVYRFGGEEFCVVLRDTADGTDDAAEVAERIRAALEAQSFDIGTSSPLHKTASLGVATALDRDPGAVIARADAALYEAKHGGRNRVCVA